MPTITMPEVTEPVLEDWRVGQPIVFRHERLPPRHGRYLG